MNFLKFIFLRDNFSQTTNFSFFFQLLQVPHPRAFLQFLKLFQKLQYSTTWKSHFESHFFLLSLDLYLLVEFNYFMYFLQYNIGLMILLKFVSVQYICFYFTSYNFIYFMLLFRALIYLYLFINFIQIYHIFLFKILSTIPFVTLPSHTSFLHPSTWYTMIFCLDHNRLFVFYLRLLIDK